MTVGDGPAQRPARPSLRAMGHEPAQDMHVVVHGCSVEGRGGAAFLSACGLSELSCVRVFACSPVVQESHASEPLHRVGPEKFFS